MVESWSEEDHLRHFLYESVYSALSELKWEDRIYDVLDFGSMWLVILTVDGKRT